MQQLSVNRFFRHKFFTNCIVQSVMEKGLNEDDNSPHYHLYVKLVSGDDMIGMSGETVFMLSTSRRQDEWTSLLEDWAHQNMYEDYQPHLMSQSDAAAFLAKCRAMKTHGIRLGQAMINALGDKTPTPNIAIFSTHDEQEAIDWLYSHHVDSQ